MIYGIYLSANGLVTQGMRADTIANNLANVNTTAFKKNKPEFQDLLYQTNRAAGAERGAADQGEQLAHAFADHAVDLPVDAAADAGGQLLDRFVQRVEHVIGDHRAARVPVSLTQRSANWRGVKFSGSRSASVEPASASSVVGP